VFPEDGTLVPNHVFDIHMYLILCVWLVPSIQYINQPDDYAREAAALVQRYKPSVFTPPECIVASVIRLRE